MMLRNLRNRQFLSLRNSWSVDKERNKLATVADTEEETGGDTIVFIV